MKKGERNQCCVGICFEGEHVIRVQMVFLFSYKKTLIPS